MSYQSHNDLMHTMESYGNGYYIGTVIANNDPLGIGRIQVNVPGLYDASTGEVPWIGPIKDSPFGFGKSSKNAYGVYGYPQVNSIVMVELQNGDEHKPLYIPLPTVANANALFASPNVWGYQDPDGNLMIYDMAAHTYKFVTAGGAVINIDANGKRITQVNGDQETSNGDWSVQVTGNASITSTGNTTVNAQGNATVETQGNIQIQAGGTATYTAAVHQFHGPVTMDSTMAAGGSITDLTSQGNTKTVGDMRQIYDIHTHPIPEGDTGVPNQQI